MNNKLFRDDQGSVKKMLSNIEGISFKESPMDFFILLARYKFAARFLKKHHFVLDAGCGKGYGSVFLSKFAREVVGADFDEDLLSTNSQEHADVPNLHFTKIDLLELSKEHHKKYDVVVSMDVIEHFSQDRVVDVAKNYAACLKQGGFAVIGTPNIASRSFASQRRLDTHPFEFTHQQFEQTLNAAFKNVFLFTMTDEIVSTQFPGLSWYLLALCTK